MSAVPDSNEPRPQGDPTPPAEAPGLGPAPLLAQTTVSDLSRLQASLTAVGAALVAAFLAWGIGEQTYDYYRPSPGAQQNARDFTAMNREKGIADRKNSAIVFGTFGALLGLFSGAAGGALRRSIPGGSMAALAGLLVGGIAGALVSYELVPIYARFYSDEAPSLLLSFLVRGGIWAVVGMAAGLALGWGWQGFRGIPGTLIGGLTGSVCGTIAFEVANALLFPADRNDAVIPSSMQSRLLAHLFVSVGVAIGAVLLGHRRSLQTRQPSQVHS